MEQVCANLWQCGTSASCSGDIPKEGLDNQVISNKNKTRFPPPLHKQVSVEYSRRINTQHLTLVLVVSTAGALVVITV